MTALIAAIAILLVSVIAVSFLAARKIAAEARRTEEKARELRLHLYVADMNVAYQAIQEDNLARARQILTHYLPQARSTGDRTSLKNQEDLRRWDWRHLWSLSRDDSMAVGRRAGASGGLERSNQSVGGCNRAAENFRWASGWQQFERCCVQPGRQNVDFVLERVA